jgi:rod shape-determining protein MreB
MPKFFSNMFSNDVGIDLGTANTLVYVSGRGIVINEPSVVAVNQKTGRVVAVGKDAKDMLGRTPPHIIAVRPLVDGVISDYEVTEEMMSYLLRRADVRARKIFGPRVVVGVPSGTTNVERRAVRDAARSAGARQVYIVEEPMAAAIGLGLPIHEPVGTMIVDIGGGTTDIAVISLGGIVNARNLKVAGDRMNIDIVSYVRSQHKLLIGEKTAERLKMEIGSAMAMQPAESPVRGRDLVSGLPREVIISDIDIRVAMSQAIDFIVEAIKQVLETTPPEILGDVMNKGIYLAGGGALINGLKEMLQDYLGIPIIIADEPLMSVAKGTGAILENLAAFRDIVIYNEDDVPLKKF